VLWANSGLKPTANAYSLCGRSGHSREKIDPLPIEPALRKDDSDYRQMDFLCLLFFRLLHQTSAVSAPIAEAMRENTEGNVAGSFFVMTGVEFVLFCTRINSPLGVTIAPDGSLKYSCSIDHRIVE
jgi:hypothetical protein